MHIGSHPLIRGVLAVGVTGAVLTGVACSGQRPELGSEFSRLGLEVWQNEVQHEMSTIDDHTVEVSMTPGPFELRLAKREEFMPVQVCAWVDDSIFDLRPGSTLWDTYCFKPGMGMAVGPESSELLLNNRGHHYLTEDRITSQTSTHLKKYFSSVQLAVADLPQDEATSVEESENAIFLAAFVDSNENDVVEEEEYQYVELINVISSEQAKEINEELYCYLLASKAREGNLTAAERTEASMSDRHCLARVAAAEQYALEDELKERRQETVRKTHENLK